MLESSPDIAVVYDPVRDRIVYANRPAEAIAGHTPEQLRALIAVSECLVDSARERTFLRDLARCTEEELRQAEIGILHRDGAVRRLVFRAMPIEFSSDHATRVLLVASHPPREADEPPPSLDREALAVLSHELRNPLDTLRHAADLLCLQEERGDLHRLSSIIDRQTRQLARLVETLLDVSRIGHGRLSLHCQTVDLTRLARDAAEAHQPIAERRGLSLTVEASEPLHVHGDAARLAQVFDNLLNNAIKFTDSGRVTVHARRSGDGAEVEVTDSGIGLTLEQRAGLFEPFGRRHSSSRGGGLGLGLPLVKGIIDLHGGTIAARSDGPGTGTSITVCLPACEPGEETDEEPVPPSRGTSVLIIEDDEDAAELLQHMLRRTGHRVFVARDGPEGLALARAQRPDVIVCDVGLREMSGYEVVTALRSDPALRETPAVALTGYAQPEDRRLAKATGFDEHLTKPVEMSTLRRVIARLAAGSDPR